MSTNEKVAIKALKSPISNWNDCFRLSEVKALEKLNKHPNIIKLKEVVRETNSKVFLIFEYMEMNLYGLIEKLKRNRQLLSENRVKLIIGQILNGLEYMHSNNFIHRDLKPENILINYSENKDQIKVKIADFGLAKQVSNSTFQMTDYVCTRWYRAPECVLKSTNYNNSVDIFALGCIWAEIYTLKPLFPGDSEKDQLSKMIKILGTPKYSDWSEGYKLINNLNLKFQNTKGIGLKDTLKDISDQGLAVLSKMLEYNSDKRPSAKSLLQNPYFLHSASKQTSPLENSFPNPPFIDLSYNNKNQEKSKNYYSEVNKNYDKTNFFNPITGENDLFIDYKKPILNLGSHYGDNLCIGIPNFNNNYKDDVNLFKLNTNDREKQIHHSNLSKISNITNFNNIPPRNLNYNNNYNNQQNHYHNYKNYYNSNSNMQQTGLYSQGGIMNDIISNNFDLKY